MSKYRKSAKGQECQVRLPGICNHNPETTVLAHLPYPAMGKKGSDLEAAYACFDCHEVLDRRNRRIVFSNMELRLAHLEGAVRTRAIWRAKGWID